MAYLRREGKYSTALCPDIVLLDLNMPRKDGRQALAEMKSDPGLTHIPVIILSTSENDAGVAQCYRLHANAFLIKPIDLDDFQGLMRTIEAFWLNLARLPSASPSTKER